MTNEDLKAALNIHLLRDRISLILSGSAKTGIGIEVRAREQMKRMRAKWRGRIIFRGERVRENIHELRGREGKGNE